MAMMKKLTSAIVASSLVLSLVGTAAATTPDKVDSAAARMATLGLVQGKGGPDLALGDSITRAELVTVIVRAFGQGQNAQYLNGVAAFPDTANHWASGNIAMATKLIAERSNGSEVVGLPDGTFNPDAQVTAAEAVAFLMKFTGAPKDESLSWPDNYLQGAVNAGIITAEDLANLEGVKNAPATRGLAFYLADSAFYGYKLAEGSTVYRTFVDTVGPELSIATQAPAAPTLDSKITVTGTVANAQSVFVGTPDKVATITDGTFTVEADLALGENNVVVTAVDLVGNTTERTLKVTRTVGAASVIEAADITVAAGATVDVAAAVKDSVGNTLEGSVFTGESAVGAYADGKFTAGEKAGEGTLTLKSGELTKDVKVTVVAADLAKVVAANGFAAGDAVKLIGVDAYGNPVDGVTFSEETENGYIEGDRFVATDEGTYTVKGTKGDITVESVIGAFGDVDELAVEAPESIVANGESTIIVTVKAVDENGIVVADYDGFVRYEGELEPEEDTVMWEETDAAVARMIDGVATFELKAPEAVEGLDEVDADFYLYEEYKEATGEDEVDEVADGSTSIDVEEQVATTIKLDADEYLPVNTEIPAEIEVQILDQAGEEMVDGTWEFEVEIDGPAELGDDYDEEMDLASGDTFEIVPEHRDDTGDVTVTVSSDDEDLDEATATIKAVVAGPARGIELTADEETAEAGGFEYGTITDEPESDGITYTVQVVDRNGVPTENEDKEEVTVKFGDLLKTKLGGFSVWNFAVTDETRNGIAALLNDDNEITVVPDQDTGEAEIVVKGVLADEYTVSAEADDLNESEVVNSAIVADEDNMYIGFKAAKMFVQDGEEVNLVAQLYDIYGNVVKKAGVAVEFAAGTIAAGALTEDYDDVELDGDDEAVIVETDANGQAKVVADLTKNAPDTGLFVRAEAKGEIEMAAVDDLPFYSFASADVELVPNETVPASIDVEVVDEELDERSRNPQADEDVRLKVTVKDDEGDEITDWADFADFFKVDVSRDDSLAVTLAYGAADVSEAPESDDEAWVSDTFAETDAGNVTYSVQFLAAENTLVDTRSISVRAGAIAALSVEDGTYNDADDEWTLEVEEDEVVEITLNLTDIHHNLVSRSDVNADYVFNLLAVGAGVNLLDDTVTIKEGRTAGTFEVSVPEDLPATATITVSTTDPDGDGPLTAQDWAVINLTPAE